MTFDHAYLLLSIQRGLLDRTSPSLRAVTADLDESQNLFVVHFFYDGKITDKLYDLASCACAEADPGVFPYSLNDDIAIQLDSPLTIPIQGRLIYLRKESIPTKCTQPKAIKFATHSTPLLSAILLAIQDSLLGKINPELRQVTITTNESARQIDVYFFHDGPISKENLQLSLTATDELRTSFSKFSVTDHVLRLDAPEKVPTLNGRVAYARNEED
jgi:hypothetical protein